MKNAKHEIDRTYLFPEPSLAWKSNSSLLDLIASNLAAANDQTDGTDPNSDVRIDHAMDICEQARDILPTRDHAFTEADREQMSFLDWPLTPEQQAEKDRLDELAAVALKLAQSRAEAQREDMRSIVRALLRDEELPGVDVSGIRLEIGDATIGRGFAVSGRAVLSMVEKVKTITGSEPRIAYCCSAIGITFAEDPKPGWLFEFPLSKQPDLWTLIKEWMRTPDLYLHASVSDHRPAAAGKGEVPVFVSISDMFEPAPAA